MIYAMSDIHGCYDKYIRLLEKINFSDTDTLYVLGDVIDRGDGGIDILFDMANRKNVIPLLGNHEYFAYKILYDRVKRGKECINDKSYLTKFCGWFKDGGKPTYEAFSKLSEEKMKFILAYMKTFFYFDEVEVGGRKFFLSHTVPPKFRMNNLLTCHPLEFIIGDPDYDLVYFEDQYIVTGHTPTLMFGEEYEGKIYKENNHIAIDCGAVFNNPLGCICLDTLEEFYSD